MYYACLALLGLDYTGRVLRFFTLHINEITRFNDMKLSSWMFKFFDQVFKKSFNYYVAKHIKKIISIGIIIKGLKLPNRIHATTKRGNSRSFMYIGETGYYSNLPYTYILLIHTICKYYRIALWTFSSIIKYLHKQFSAIPSD